MTYRVFTTKLRKLGCEFARQGPGSHERGSTFYVQGCRLNVEL